MTVLTRSMVFSLAIATAAGCGRGTVEDHWPVAGDRVLAEITPASPWKAKQFAQFCVRFKVLDSDGNERGYLKEADVPPETTPRAEITVFNDKGKSSTLSAGMTADC